MNDTSENVAPTIDVRVTVSVESPPGDTLAGENVLVPPSGGGWMTIVYVASASGAKPFDA